MADGDLAESVFGAGSTPPDTSDKRLGAQWMRRILDRLASHVQSGTHPWTAITGKPNVATQDDVTNLNNSIAAEGNFRNTVDIAIRQGFLGSDSYNRFISGSWRSLVIQDDGTLGQRTSSSSRFKAQIEPAPIDWRVILRDEDLEPVSYVRRDELAAARRESREPQRHIGLIAERLHRAGLGAFVQYDDQGRPDGIHYDELAIAALGGIRAAVGELDELRARLDKAGI